MFLKNFRKFSKNNLLVLFVCLFINQTILSEGFLSGTLVKTKNDYTPIDKLKENDLVTSYSFKDKFLVDGKISKIQTKHYKTCIKLIIDGKEIITAPDHKFYCPLNEKYHWVKAKDLKANDFISSNLIEYIRIDNVVELNQEANFYCLSIDKYKNFFVSEQNIFVHNFAIVIPIFEIVIGGGFKWLLGWSALASAAAGLAIVNIAKNNGADISGLGNMDLRYINRYQPERVRHLDFEKMGYTHIYNPVTEYSNILKAEIQKPDDNKLNHWFGTNGRKHGFVGGPNDEDPKKWWEKIMQRVKEAYNNNGLKYKDGCPYWEVNESQNVNPNFGDLIIRGVIHSGIIKISDVFLKRR